ARGGTAHRSQATRIPQRSSPSRTRRRSDPGPAAALSRDARPGERRLDPTTTTSGSAMSRSDERPAPGAQATGTKVLDELDRRDREAELGGGVDRIAKQHEAGKLTARERIGKLLDPGSFQEY